MYDKIESKLTYLVSIGSSVALVWCILLNIVPMNWLSAMSFVFFIFLSLVSAANIAVRNKEIDNV